jgi:hypothetical protein
MTAVAVWVDAGWKTISITFWYLCRHLDAPPVRLPEQAHALLMDGPYEVSTKLSCPPDLRIC